MKKILATILAVAMLATCLLYTSGGKIMQKVLAKLQKLGKALMLPIACLPVAGILMGICLLYTSSKETARPLSRKSPGQGPRFLFCLCSGPVKRRCASEILAEPARNMYNDLIYNDRDRKPLLSLIKEDRLCKAKRTSFFMPCTIGTTTAPPPSLPCLSLIHIYLETAHGGQRKAIKPGDKPEVSFALQDDELIAVYAYCNLHGLWKTEIKK